MTELQNKRALYPRVSEIIGKQTESEMRKIPIEHLVNASLKGHRVHAYCTAYIKGLIWPDVEEELEPYVNAFTDWASENIKKLILCSTRLYDDIKRFTGEPDMIVELKDGKRALIDIKTNAVVSKSWPIQLAAYDHLCRVNGIDYHAKKRSQAVRARFLLADIKRFCYTR